MRAALLLVAAFVSGCIATTYTKSITVRKDESGRVIETIETETIVQPNQAGYPIKLEHLKDVKP